MPYIEAREWERRIAAQVLAVVGRSGDSLPGRALVRVISPAVTRFAEVAATCDRLVAEEGLVAAARWTLSRLSTGLRVEGAEAMPPAGPVLIVANHPGSVDALALAASSGRDDLRILTWPMPFLEYLPHVEPHLISAPAEQARRAGAVREGIRHLQQGGALLLFAGGRLEPDPATMRGAEAELSRWSRSIELFLRAVPEATVVPAIVSGVLAQRYVRHPVTWLRRGRLPRQRMAMVLQFVQQMRGKRIPLVPRVGFGAPLRGADLEGDPWAQILASVRQLLSSSVQAGQEGPGRGSPAQFT